MTDRINIHEPIYELCRRLGLEPTTVSEIIFRPDHVRATVFKVNANGSKYIGTDGAAASTEVRFDVTT
jgi:hypothetical protein